MAEARKRNGSRKFSSSSASKPTMASGLGQVHGQCVSRHEGKIPCLSYGPGGLDCTPNTQPGMRRTRYWFRNVFSGGPPGKVVECALWRNLWLVQTLQPNALVLIDAQHFMRGDEIGLGTPHEDMASLYAAARGVPKEYLVCIGFGINAFRGVCHTHFLENAAALIPNDGHVGTWSLMYEMEEFRLYREACDFVMARMPRHPSIVNISIISAVMGGFGDQHATQRTNKSELFFNHLMAKPFVGKYRIKIVIPAALHSP